jgi:hypothetical protein
VTGPWVLTTAAASGWTTGSVNRARRGGLPAAVHPRVGRRRHRPAGCLAALRTRCQSFRLAGEAEPAAPARRQGPCCPGPSTAEDDPLRLPSYSRLIRPAGPWETRPGRGSNPTDPTRPGPAGCRRPNSSRRLEPNRPGQRRNHRPAGGHGCDHGVVGWPGYGEGSSMKNPCSTTPGRGPDTSLRTTPTRRSAGRQRRPRPRTPRPPPAPTLDSGRRRHCRPHPTPGRPTAR